MRLTTVTQYRDQMSALTSQYDAILSLQRQISTSKKIDRSSENPVLAGKINSINNAMEVVNSYQLNSTLAESRSSLFGDVIKEASSLVVRVQELTQSAQNDTLNNSDRNNIAQELKGHLENLMRLANSQDNNGDYIFSGMNINKPSYKSDNVSYTYQGATESTKISLGSNTNIIYNESGFRVFGDIKTGNGLFTTSADTTNNTGTGIAGTVISSKGASFVPDDYVISFVHNSNGQLAYRVDTASGTRVVPPPPLSVPGDAPEYTSGNDINFKGINLQITGKPNVGDVYNVTRSKTQNVFETVQGIINTLSTPVNSDKELADMHQALGNAASSMGQVFNHFQEYSTEIGNRMKSIDDFMDFSKQILLDQRILLRDLSEADLTEVIPELTQRLTGLEITQQSYMKIQETFNRLFNGRG